MHPRNGGLGRARPPPCPRALHVRSFGFNCLLAVLWTGALLLVAALLWHGAGYYTTPLLLRPRHPAYWQLKPGGPVGHGVGVAGTTMMLLLLLYSARKRCRFMCGWGALSRWLDIHIWMGVVGPLLVIVHTSFRVRGLVALSFWSMIAVALSGVLGRYLYLQIPRTRAGDAMTLEQIEARDRELSRAVATRFNVSEEVLGRLEQLTTPRERRGRSLVGSVTGALVDDVALPFRVRRALRDVALPRDVSAELRRCLRSKARLARRIQLLGQMQRLFHYWHVVHKPFAVIMYLFMFVHVIVALMTGYAWGVGW